MVFTLSAPVIFALGCEAFCRREVVSMFQSRCAVIGIAQLSRLCILLTAYSAKLRPGESSCVNLLICADDDQRR